MSLPQNWPSYVGIGLSVASLIVSVIALRRSLRVKRLDLRLELRKTAADNDQQVRSLEKTHREGAAVARRRGGGEGYAPVRKHGSLEESDRRRHGCCPQAAPDHWRAGEPPALSEKELEDELVAAHSRKREIEGYLGKYKAALDQDDKDRDFLRAAAYDRTRSK